MEFKVTFTNPTNYLVDIEPSHVGTDKLIEVRNVLGVNIPSERVNSLVYHTYKREYDFTVSESLAFESERFKSSCFSRVEVKGIDAFMPFIELKTSVQRDENTDEILTVSFYHELNKLKVLEAWEVAGFPIDWDLSNAE